MTIVKVIWKDEGDFGFISTFTQSDLDHVEANPCSLGVPYDPDRLQAYGTVEDARAIAVEHDAVLELQ